MTSYPNAPLVLVALEVRYPELADPIPTSDLRRVLRELLPVPGSLTHSELTLAFNSEPVVTQRDFPRFATRDGRTSLVLTPTSLVLETSTYDSYETFRSLVESSVKAVYDLMAIDGIRRLGLRFIDEIRVPGIDQLPGDWNQWIVDGLLVPIAPQLHVSKGELAPRTWQGNVAYDTGDDEWTVKLRYGPTYGQALSPNSPTKGPTREDGVYFLLDSDAAWQPMDEVPAFTVDSILAACDRVHEPLSVLFKSVVKPQLVEEVFCQSDRGE